MATSERGQAKTGDEFSDLPWVFIHRHPGVDFLANFKAGLQDHFRLLDPASFPDEGRFQELAKSVRALLCWYNIKLDSETLDRLPSLRCVMVPSSGVNHIDLAECRRRGIAVANAGPAFAADVAEYTVGLLIDVLRRISASNRYVRAGLWSLRGDYPLGSKLTGRRVGIVGMGYIGSEVAKLLEAFGCRISYLSRNQKPHLPFPYYANAIELATNSDVLIVCCALTNETQRMIDKDVLKALGNQGVVINVSRGAVVNEKDLVRFLVDGEIGGAGLDVFEDEPEVPKELFGLDNVVLSPHRGVATPESQESLLAVTIANLKAFFLNKPLLSEVKLH